MIILNNDKNFLATEPVGTLLFRLSVPAVIAQIINLLYNIIDRIYIGHMPGEGALALTGVGICMPVILIVSAFSSLVSAGASRASIALGEGNRNKAEKILGNCISLLLGISAVLTVCLFIWCRPMLMAFGGSSNTIEYAVSYMKIYALGTVFVQMTLGMNAFITAQGFSKISMLTVLIGAVLNILLDPIFIYAFHMGVKGAALATIISQCISCIWVISFLISKKSSIRLKKQNLFPEFSVIWNCVSLGIAPFIMQGSESVISVCFNSSLQKYGGDLAVGAMTILTSTMSFAMLPIQGIAQGAQPISGYNYGAGNAPRVRETFRLLLKICCSYAFVFWAAVMLFPGTFASIFTSDIELRTFTAKALRIYLGVLFLFGIQMSCQMTFISLGNALSSAIVAIVRKFVLLLPLIYIMPHVIPDKAFAVYWAEPAADVLAVTFTAILFSKQFKKALNKIS